MTLGDPSLPVGVGGDTCRGGRGEPGPELEPGLLVDRLAGDGVVFGKLLQLQVWVACCAQAWSPRAGSTSTTCCSSRSR